MTVTPVRMVSITKDDRGTGGPFGVEADGMQPGGERVGQGSKDDRKDVAGVTFESTRLTGVVVSRKPAGNRSVAESVRKVSPSAKPVPASTGSPATREEHNTLSVEKKRPQAIRNV